MVRRYCEYWVKMRTLIGKGLPETTDNSSTALTYSFRYLALTSNFCKINEAARKGIFKKMIEDARMEKIVVPKCDESVGLADNMRPAGGRWQRQRATALAWGQRLTLYRTCILSACPPPQ